MKKSKIMFSMAQLSLAVSLVTSMSSYGQESQIKSPAQLYQTYQQQILSFDKPIKEIIDNNTVIENPKEAKDKLTQTKSSLEVLQEEILAQSCAGESNLVEEKLMTANDPNDPVLIFSCDKVLEVLIEQGLKNSFAKIEELLANIEQTSTENKSTQLKDKIETASDESSAQESPSEQEKVQELENIICKQENKLKELENQVVTIAEQSMQPIMMQMMMQMMQQQMNFMHQFGMQQSVLDRTDNLNSMMIMSAINNMNMQSQFGMMGLMGTLSMLNGHNGLGQQQNPYLLTTDNMQSKDFSDYALTNPMNINQPMLTYPANQTQGSNFGYNFNNTVMNSDRTSPQTSESLNTSNLENVSDVNTQGTGLDS